MLALLHETRIDYIISGDNHLLKIKKYKNIPIIRLRSDFMNNKSNSKKLVLTHLSARYKDTKDLEDDAKDCFDNTVVAYDFMKVNL